MARLPEGKETMKDSSYMVIGRRYLTFRSALKGLGALLVVLLAARLGTGILSAWYLDGALSGSRKAGLLVGPVKSPLKAWQSPRRSKGERYFRASLSLFEGMPYKDAGVTYEFLHGKRKAGDLTRIRAILAARADAIDLAKKGARHPLLPLAPAPTTDEELRLRSIRECSRFILAQARLEAMDGRGDEALNSCRGALRFPDVLLHRHVLIDELVRLAVIRDAAREVGKVLATSTPSEAACLRMSTALLAFDPHRTFLRSLQCEAHFCLDIFRKLERSPTAFKEIVGFEANLVAAATGRASGWIFRPYFDLERVVYLEHMSRLYRWVADHDGIMATAASRKGPTKKVPSYSLIGQFLIPNLSRAFERVIQIQGHADIAIIHLAAEIVRRRTGAYPASLELIPEKLVPRKHRRDPYGTGTFVYRLVKGRPKVYSVGRNGKDEGGAGDDRLWTSR